MKGERRKWTKGGLGQRRGCPHLAMALVSPELGPGRGSWGDVGDLMVVQGESGLAGGGVTSPVPRDG